MGSSVMQHRSYGGVGQNTDVDNADEALVASETPAKWVILKALPGNTGIIYVGEEGVGETDGWPLSAGEESPWIAVPGDDLANIWVIASAANQGVAYMWET